MKVVHRIDGRTALASEALTSQSQFNDTLPEARRDNRTSRQLKLCLVQVKLQSEEHEQDCKNEYRRKTGFLDQVEYILESAVRHGLHSVFPGNAKAKRLSDMPRSRWSKREIHINTARDSASSAPP